jgi:hypothetical protein
VGFGNGILTSSVYIAESVSPEDRGSVVMVRNLKKKHISYLATAARVLPVRCSCYSVPFYTFCAIFTMYCMTVWLELPFLSKV